MTTRPILLLLGAGARIGASVATKFAHLGYTVALVSRNASNEKTAEGFHTFKADLSEPDTVPALFKSVQEKLHAAPSVVIYNAATLTPPPDQDAVLSIPSEAFIKDLNINTVSAYIAAQQAVTGWASLPKDAKKTFIYTGNAANTKVIPFPMTLTLGTGKAASAYWIGLADISHAADGARFFYADERQADGHQKGMAIDGDAHADFYAQLATNDANVPWHATFVKDKGYIKF